MDVARKIENVKVDRRGRCIDDVRVVDCGVLEEWICWDGGKWFIYLFWRGRWGRR